MDVLYAVMHRTAGPLATSATPSDAARELVRIVRDEPDWLDDLRLERIDIRVDARDRKTP